MTKKHLFRCAIAVAALYAYSFPVSALPKCPEGVWHNCTASYTYDNGNVYEGDFINGKRTGKGTLTWPNGDVYEGDFINGKRTGKGTLTWPDGFVYKGDFIDDKRTGKGTFTWPDGAVYEGDWVNNKRTGKGTYTLADGTVYEGDFVNGKESGQGTKTFANGDVYKGDWVNGKVTGQGTYTLANGIVYEGDWVNGQFLGSDKSIANRNDSEQNNTQTISWGKAHPAIKFIATEPGVGLRGNTEFGLFAFGGNGRPARSMLGYWMLGVIDAQKISKCSYTAIQKFDVREHYRYGKVQKTFIDFNKINWKTRDIKNPDNSIDNTMSVSYECKGDCISVYGVHSLPVPPRKGWSSATSISFVFKRKNSLGSRGLAALSDIEEMCSASSSDY